MKAKLRIFDALWLIGLAAYILMGTPLVPFHGDEATQIYMSRDYAYQFLQGDLSLVQYSDPPISPTEQQLRLLNGTLPKYLMGLAWHVSGYQIADINEQWDWGADWHYNTTTGHAPSEGLLNVTRFSSAAVLALGLIPVFAVGMSLGGRRTAHLASLYFALSPALLLNGRRAMMEGALITFGMFALWAGIYFLRGRDTGRGLQRVGAVGALALACGLAIASKHTAIFTVISVFAVCAAFPLVMGVLKRETLRISYFVELAAAGVLAFMVFLALNPAWWDAPFSRPFEVLNLRSDLLAGQTAAFGGYADAGAALTGFFNQVFVGLPQYFEVSNWAGFIGDQINAYEASAWRGVAVGGSVIGGVILLVLCVVGVFALISEKESASSTRVLVLVWAVMITLSTLLLTPLEWARYYLPMLPVIGLLAAVGTRFASGFTISFISRR